MTPRGMTSPPRPSRTRGPNLGPREAGAVSIRFHKAAKKLYFSICEVVDEAVPVKAPGIYIFPLARRSERFPEIRVVQVL